MQTSKKLGAVLVAGGMGTRLNMNLPKAFVPLAGKELFLYSLAVLDAYEAIEDIVLVIPREMHTTASNLLKKYAFSKNIILVAGGMERWQSVQNGVNALPHDSAVVLVHDAARPFLTPAIISDLIPLMERYTCAITATPVTDTIRTFRDAQCTGTVDRTTLLKVGTPQLFSRTELHHAFAKAAATAVKPTDEAMLMEQAGFAVGFAWGDPFNFKITGIEDFTMAEALIKAGIRPIPHTEKHR